MWQMLTAPFRKSPPRLTSNIQNYLNEDLEDPMPTETSVLDELAGKRVRVYVNPRGIHLSGKLVGHDSDTIILQDNYGKTVVYKHQAISVTQDLTNE